MKPSIVFFGTSEFSVTILEYLARAGLSPVMVVTPPDRKVGRKQVLTPSPVKAWSLEHSIDVIESEHPDDVINTLKGLNPDIFVVASYGYILSQDILDIPSRGTLNVHTSLLPLYRGACPIESAILHGDKKTGSTIMLMDHKMDHGPLLAQASFDLDGDMNRLELFEKLAHHGGELLVQTIPLWLDGSITPHEQDHERATYCHKIEKHDGDITHDPDEVRYRKYLGYFGWPGVFFFDEDGKRVKVTKARYDDGQFIIERVIPEGKNEMEYVKKPTTK